jgi:hypothetical protein
MTSKNPEYRADVVDEVARGLRNVSATTLLQFICSLYYTVMRDEDDSGMLQQEPFMRFLNELSPAEKANVLNKLKPAFTGHLVDLTTYFQNLYRRQERGEDVTDPSRFESSEPLPAVTPKLKVLK